MLFLNVNFLRFDQQLFHKRKIFWSHAPRPEAEGNYTNKLCRSVKKRHIEGWNVTLVSNKFMKRAKSVETNLHYIKNSMKRYYPQLSFISRLIKLRKEALKQIIFKLSIIKLSFIHQTHWERIEVVIVTGVKYSKLETVM